MRLNANWGHLLAWETWKFFFPLVIVSLDLRTSAGQPTELTFNFHFNFMPNPILNPILISRFITWLLSIWTLPQWRECVQLCIFILQRTFHTDCAPDSTVTTLLVLRFRCNCCVSIGPHAGAVIASIAFHWLPIDRLSIDSTYLHIYRQWTLFPLTLPVDIFCTSINWPVNVFPLFCFGQWIEVDDSFEACNMPTAVPLFAVKLQQ